MSTTPWGPPAKPSPPPPTGALPWALGLVVLFFLPFVSTLVACVLMIGVGLAQRSKGPLAAANGRRAASWGLTYLLVSVVLVTTHFVLLWLLTRDGRVSGFFPLGIPITLWGAITLLHLGVCLVGAVGASNRRVARVPAIGFFPAGVADRRTTERL